MKCIYKPSLLKHRMTLQAESKTEDGQGGFGTEWEDEADVWAQIEPLKGYERMQAMQMQSPITHRVLLRWRRGLTTAKRLRYGGRIFEIKEIINLEEANVWHRLMCVENNNQASEELWRG